MKLLSRHPQKGSLVLVVLCFMAVLGIGLAGYLTVSSQSMRLSNRASVNGVSRQLAEIGLEQALWAFNRNDWSGWTLSGATATRTISFASTKYGSSGLSTSIKLRVDNYNAYNLSATWNSTTTYQVNDLVGYNGVWYRCVKNANLNNDPSTQTSLAWWAPAPVPWAWSSNTAYTADYDVVCSGGTWYRCTTSHTSGSTFAVGTNWASIPAPSLSWSSSTAYAVGAFVFSGGTWYRCTTAHTNQVPPNGGFWNPNTTAPYISWAWRSGYSYKFNDLVYYLAGMSGNWYRCITPGASTPTTANWENALSGSWAWASTSAYNLNDVVYSGGSFYRCILAHTNHAPPNSTYWSTAPLLSTDWNPGRQYAVNDTAKFNGVWYRCRSANSGQVPPTIAPYYDTYWASTADTTRQWAPNTAYSAGIHRSYGGVWYECVTAHTNQSPNNPTYWTAMDAPVVYAEGTAVAPGGTSNKTLLRATIAPAPLFPNAAAASSTLSVSGGGTVDSYNGSVYAMSASGTYSTYTYNQITSPFTAGSPNLGYSAVLAAGNTASTAITLGSTAVKGYVTVPSNSSAPYAPLFSSGGSVKGPSSPGSPNIDLTRVSRSPYIPVFDTLPRPSLSSAFGSANFPKGTALVLASTINLGTPGAATPSRYYYNGNLTLGTGSVTNLRINGPVILYINGDLTITAAGSTGRIDITNTGSAEIHVVGGLKADAAGEGIVNQTANPKSLIIICDTSTSTSHFFSEGVNSLYGVIYVPNTTNSNGFFNDNTNTTVYGAVSAKKITYSGASLNLHYDTSLRYATFGGVDQPYTITEWRELTDPAEKITLP